VDKRISTLAMAIQMHATIHDLEAAELCYAPQFGSAKDPINFAGMIAANLLRGDMPVSHWHSIENEFLLDVRAPMELAVDRVPGAVNIPLGQLRARLDELPRDREILVVCRSGTRSYYATRILLQHGFKARNVVGGMLLRSQLQGAERIDRGAHAHHEVPETDQRQRLHSVPSTQRAVPSVPRRWPAIRPNVASTG
jgi:rhodanese-related sulfurtransferase